MKSFTTTAALSTLALLSSSYACSTVENNQVTFYGFPDNDPASAQVAYSCGGRNNIAGGTGTYADPVTFASAPGEFDKCEIIYLPLLKKYLRMEDTCEQCTSDFKGGKKHIDIWTGSNTKSGGQTQIDCEDKLTTGGNYGLVRQPPQGLDVDTTPLFDNGKCNTGAVFESNKASCSAGASSGSSGSASGASTTLATSVKAGATPTSAAPKSQATQGSSSGGNAGNAGSDGSDDNGDDGDDDEDCSDDEE